MFGTYILRTFPVHHFDVSSYFHALDGFYWFLVCNILLCRQTGSNIDSFIFIDKGPVKNLHHTNSWLFYVLDIDDSDEGCTVDCETVVCQHKDSLYYSESEEEE